MKSWTPLTLPLALTPLLVVGLGACTAPGPQTSFTSDDPSARTRAIARAARDDATQDIPELIEMLQSDDAAMRMMAIGTLEKMTGETFGYRYFDPIAQRRQAIDRWVQWSVRGGARGIDAGGSGS